MTECPTCGDDRVIEEPIFGRFAVEATRCVPCPRCCKGQYLDAENRLTKAVMVRRSSHRWLRLRDLDNGSAA